MHESQKWIFLIQICHFETKMTPFESFCYCFIGKSTVFREKLLIFDLNRNFSGENGRLTDGNEPFLDFENISNHSIKMGPTKKNGHFREK